MKKLYVFDFHGVLEKGTEKALMIISNMALEAKNYSQRLTQEDALKYYGLKWSEIFQKALNLSEKESMDLYEECVKLDDSNEGIITKYTLQNDNASKVLENILLQKNDYILISNTRPKALKMFIKSANLEKYFNDNNSFAVNVHENGQLLSKKIVLENYLKDKHYDKIVIIGDSSADMELKKVSPHNSITYLYAHPWLSHKDCEADYKIRDLICIFFG